MNTPLKVTKIGNSAGVILHEELLARLRVGDGDQLYLTKAPDVARLAAQVSDFVAGMVMTEEIMREDRKFPRAWAN